MWLDREQRVLCVDHGRRNLLCQEIICLTTRGWDLDLLDFKRVCLDLLRLVLDLLSRRSRLVRRRWFRFIRALEWAFIPLVPARLNRTDICEIFTCSESGCIFWMTLHHLLVVYLHGIQSWEPTSPVLPVTTMVHDTLVCCTQRSSLYFRNVGDTFRQYQGVVVQGSTELLPVAIVHHFLLLWIHLLRLLKVIPWLHHVCGVSWWANIAVMLSLGSEIAFLREYTFTIVGLLVLLQLVLDHSSWSRHITTNVVRLIGHRNFLPHLLYIEACMDWLGHARHDDSAIHLSILILAGRVDNGGTLWMQRLCTFPINWRFISFIVLVM